MTTQSKGNTSSKLVSKNPQWHSLNQNNVFEQLNSSKNGISENEARTRLANYGYNEITKEKRQSSFKLP